MRKPIKIGEKEFATKKDALNYYKKILNSYKFGQVLSKQNQRDILELLGTHPKSKDIIGVGISSIRIAKLKYNTKCFELVRIDNSTEYFSYTKRINASKTYFTRFREACRQAIQEDLHKVKLAYFQKYSKKGQVKCQETGELAKWEELIIDHRQPNTFSIIVDRFIEIKGLDLEKVKFLSIDGAPDELADKKLKEEFREYHKEKANLRIVKKNLNLSRSFQGKIKRQKKDLKVIN